jgi:PAS domain S-box-containing protein
VRSLSLKWRAVYAVTALTVAVLLLASAIQMHFMRADLRRVLSDQQFALVSHTAQELDAKFDASTDLLERSAAGFPVDLLASPAGAREYYRNRPELLGIFDSVLVATPDGRMIADYPQVPGRTDSSLAVRAYFQRLLATGKPVISEPVLGRTSKEPIVLIAVPIKHANGSLAGVLIGVLNLYHRNYLGQLADAKVGKSGFFAIITKEDPPRYVIHSEKRKILQARPANANPSTTRALQGFEGSAEDTTSDPIHGLFSYKSLKSTNWLLEAVVPVDEAFLPIVEAERRLWLIALLVCFLVVPLVWALAQLTFNPLIALRDQIEKLRGAGPGFAPVPVHQAGEIGDLARSFNTLMGERASAAASLHAAERRLRMITDNMPAVIAHLDAELRFNFVNQYHETWFGRPCAEVLGLTLRELLGDQAYALAGPMAQRALAGEVVSFRREMQANAVTRHIEITYIPDRVQDGRVEGLYVLGNDITALTRTQEQLRALNADLEERVAARTAALQQSNRELEAFAYSVAHDFRGPLRAMDGYSATLVQEYGPRLDAPGRGYLARIRHATQRLGSLIEDLLRMAQLTMQELRRENVDLTALAVQAIADLRAAEPHRHVQADIATGLAAPGDRALLRSLLRELIGNAWKFTPDRADSTIEIGALPRQGGIAWYVRDNGPGFDLAHARQIFDPFARLHSNSAIAGTGIGLALAKRIVERHGGRIWVESSPGRGTTFLFTLGD